MKQQILLALPLLGGVLARPANILGKREVPQEHSHQNVIDIVNTNLKLNNPDAIDDAIFGLLGAAAGIKGAGKITDADCLQQATADQAFTNAKAAKDVNGQTFALIYRALERNTGKVGLASVPCKSIKAVNPEIAALQQHQDPAGTGAIAGNKQIALELVKQIASIGGDVTQANQASTFAPGNVDDPTAKGNTCDIATDAQGCINTLNLRVNDLSAAEITAAASAAGAAAPAAAAAAPAAAAAAPAAVEAVAADNSTAPAAAAAVGDAAAAGNSTAAAAGAKKSKGNKKGKDDKKKDDKKKDDKKKENEKKAAAAAAKAAQDAAKSAQQAAKAAKDLEGNKGKKQSRDAGNSTVAAVGAKGKGKGKDKKKNDAEKKAADAAAKAAKDAAKSAQQAAKAAKDLEGKKGKKQSARAAAEFGTCKDATITLGADGRFAPTDSASFSHGGALNINVISSFICGQLESACKADATGVAACKTAEAASTGLKGQAAADAFNKAIAA